MSSFMLLLHRPVDRPRVSTDPAVYTQVSREYMAWADRMRAEGHLKGGNKLTDDSGKIVRTTGERVSTTDGPYPESKELVGGFFLISARDYTEACHLAESCPHLKYYGNIEVRQVEEL
jgi:hypothetical protein